MESCFLSNGCASGAFSVSAFGTAHDRPCDEFSGRHLLGSTEVGRRKSASHQACFETPCFAPQLRLAQLTLREGSVCCSPLAARYHHHPTMSSATACYHDAAQHCNLRCIRLETSSSRLRANHVGGISSYSQSYAVTDRNGLGRGRGLVIPGSNRRQTRAGLVVGRRAAGPRDANRSLAFTSHQLQGRQHALSVKTSVHSRDGIGPLSEDKERSYGMNDSSKNRLQRLRAKWQRDNRSSFEVLGGSTVEELEELLVADGFGAREGKSARVESRRKSVSLMDELLKAEEIVIQPGLEDAMGMPLQIEQSEVEVMFSDSILDIDAGVVSQSSAAQLASSFERSERKSREEKDEFRQRTVNSRSSSDGSNLSLTDQATRGNSRQFNEVNFSSGSGSGSGHGSLPQKWSGRERVVDMMTAWDAVSSRLPERVVRSRDSHLLLTALKMAMPFVSTSKSAAWNQMSMRLLDISTILADLKMDAEAIAVGMLRHAVDAGTISLAAVEAALGMRVGKLLHDSIRISSITKRADVLDDQRAAAMRQFCLAFHDLRAVVIELALRLHSMRSAEAMPKWKQQVEAIEILQIWSPLAHSLGTGPYLADLDDLAFRALFPSSYHSLDSWLRSRWPEGGPVAVESCRQQLEAALRGDEKLRGLVEEVSVRGRCKSLYSMMKKLLKDGRTRMDVLDALGLRVVVTPTAAGSSIEERRRGEEACYRVREIVCSMWREQEGRLKDYIRQPKRNGYRSLHFGAEVQREGGQPMELEIQVRTVEMDEAATRGDAAHGAYKAGVSDPEQVAQLQAMVRLLASAVDSQAAASTSAATSAAPTSAATPAAAAGLLTAGRAAGEEEEGERDGDGMFHLLDRNGDGVISVEEIAELMRELGAEEDGSEEAVLLMKLLDSNTDGTICAREFEEFRRQVGVLRELQGVDEQYTRELEERVFVQMEERSEAMEVQLAEAIAEGRRGGDEVKGAEGWEQVAAESSEEYSDDESAAQDLRRRLEKEKEQTKYQALNSGSQESDVEGKENGFSDSALDSGDSKTEELRRGSWRQSLTSSSAVGTGGVRAGLESQNMATPSTVSAQGARQQQPLMKPVPVGGLISRSQGGLSGRGWLGAVQKPPLLQATAVGVASLAAAELQREAEKENEKLHEREANSSGEEASVERKVGDGGQGWLDDASISATAAAGWQSEDEEEQQLAVELREVRREMVRGKAENFKRAREHLTKLLRLHPVHGNLRVHMAQLERKSGNARGAREWYEKAVRVLEAGGQRSSAIHLRALAAWASLEAHEGHLLRARRLFQRCLQAANNGAEVKRGSSFSSSSVGGVQGFGREVRRAAVVGLHSWAMMEAREGHWKAARDLLERAEMVEPGNAVVLQSRAILEASVNSVAAARGFFRRATEAAPDDPACWQAWALFEGQRGRKEEMRRLFSRALLAKPKNIPTLQAWAIAEAEEGTEEGMEAARKLFRRCLAVNAHSIAALQAWALMEQRGGNISEARRLFEECLRIAPNSVPCLQAFAVFEKQCGNLSAARDLVSLALALSPKNAAALMLAAQLEESVGNKEVAELLYARKGIADRIDSRRRRRKFESFRDSTASKGEMQSSSSVSNGSVSRRTKFKRKTNFRPKKQTTSRDETGSSWRTLVPL